MHRILLTCTLAISAMAQNGVTDPIRASVLAVQAQREQGDFAAAARGREQARQLLERIPAAAAIYPQWVAMVAGLYTDAGRTLEARSVLLRGLALQPRSGDLLLNLADSLAQDRKLVQAVAYLEGAPLLPGPDRQAIERRLANLYQQLGRKDVPTAGEVSGDFADLVQYRLSRPQPLRTTLANARDAVRQGRTADAFVLALEAIHDEAGAPRDDAIFSEIPLVASLLASRQERGMADQLFDRLYSLAEARQADTLLPLLRVTRDHARFLAEWPDRLPAARDALARYRDLLIQAHGPDSGDLAGALRAEIELEVDHGSGGRAAAAAEQLLALEESLSGPDGLSNLSAIATAAGLYEMLGNQTRVRLLHQRSIAIADSLFDYGDFRRAAVRMQAAFALAHQQEFADAEQLAREATALDPAFAANLEQILELRADAVAAQLPSQR